jgi:hypothetical protein
VSGNRFSLSVPFQPSIWGKLEGGTVVRGVFIVSDLKSVAFRRGMYVFLFLAVMTAVEYVVAISSFNSMVLLFIIALLKAAAIVQYFMHVYRLWREESH